MSDKTIWMVRAGKGAQFVDDFIESNFVGIGFKGAGEVSSPVDKPTIESRIKLAHPSHSKGKISVSASQVKRYFDEIEPSHAVMTYDPGQRLYYVGEITSNVKNIEICSVPAMLNGLAKSPEMHFFNQHEIHLAQFRPCFWFKEMPPLMFGKI